MPKINRSTKLEDLPTARSLDTEKDLNRKIEAIADELRQMRFSLELTLQALNSRPCFKVGQITRKET